MNPTQQGHTFHIPVMGIAFSIDTPVKVAPLGISSVLSLGDDKLLERLSAYYCKKYNFPYEEITNKEEDFRAKRITSYLNIVAKIVDLEFKEVVNSIKENGEKAKKYFSLLPDYSPLKIAYKTYCSSSNNEEKEQQLKYILDTIQAGTIDVNIMTKLDSPNYNANKEIMPVEYNDAHAALRGFANSTLSASLVYSAGMNPRLYSYTANFPDFFPDENGKLKKKIILKVSDYRSALIQGKMFAKKGIWVSEYRIESGLNCGGHAFASDGYLLGPILEEFKNKKDELVNELSAMCKEAWAREGKKQTSSPLSTNITVQGGVGTSTEHDFLIRYYNVDSVGWGTPFLLVPEVTNVDDETLQLLCKATEKDVFLSEVSPLGVPFNSIRGNSIEVEKEMRIAAGKPGSLCPNRYLEFNTEFTEMPICTASRQYQKLKIAELDTKNLPQDRYQIEFRKIVNKECICNGLGNSVKINYKITTIKAEDKISICPGPNIAYFNKIASLQEMVDHIYGRINLLNDTYRPHMFIKELELYINYLKNLIKNLLEPATPKEANYFASFKENLFAGIEYYKGLIPEMKEESEKIVSSFKADLLNLEAKLKTVTWNLVPAQ